MVILPEILCLLRFHRCRTLLTLILVAQLVLGRRQIAFVDLFYEKLLHFKSLCIFLELASGLLDRFVEGLDVSERLVLYESVGVQWDLLTVTHLI